MGKEQTAFCVTGRLSLVAVAACWALVPPRGLRDFFRGLCSRRASLPVAAGLSRAGSFVGRGTSPVF